MDDENDYELERQKIIQENHALLHSLGLDDLGPAKIQPVSKPLPKPKPTKKRKQPEAPEPEGPRRRSGRLRGLEVDTVQAAAEKEEAERVEEQARVVKRKVREQVMDVGDMVEETDLRLVPELKSFLPTLPLTTPISHPTASTSAKDAYADKDKTRATTELQRLKDAYKGISLVANEKVTSERVFSMVVHPDPSKTVVLVGDKYGQLGIWDALGPGPAQPAEDDDEGPIEDSGFGRIWRVQAHARNSISCMKVDPVNASSLHTSAYDCTLRTLDFMTLKSTERFAFDDEDMLVSHFDVTPSGSEAWIVDKHGGISHCDFRDPGERRRWVVQEEGRGAKLGGVSVNPLMPHLICTASNDQHLRIWDVRHFSKLTPRVVDRLSPPEPVQVKRSPSVAVADSPSASPARRQRSTRTSRLAAGAGVDGEGDTKPDVKSYTVLDLDGSLGLKRLPTYPTSSIPEDRVAAYLASPKGKGLLRASYQHGKSCSAAYWDPWGRRILTTSYDDKLRVWNLDPQSFLLDTPLASTFFQPTTKLTHNCQTGRWLTILRAQWSQNTAYTPHFTVGNMKRTLDVVAASGERIVALWAEGVTAVPAVTASHPSKVCVVGGNTSGRVQVWSKE